MSDSQGHAVELELSAEAQEFGREALRALRAAGGGELAERAEASPEQRYELVDPVLSGLGAWELAPRGDAVELEAAAALCRSAGYWATPYPVAERLSRPVDLDVDGLSVVAGPNPVAPLAGLETAGLRWAAVTVEGERGAVTPRTAPGKIRETAFVTPVDIAPIDANGAQDLALALVLPCWTLLGMLDRAIELTRSHVLVREQFGRPLAQFQGVQFQLTDAEVDRRGADLLARYALWSIQAGRPDAVEDALSLRLAVLEAADSVFRICHQLHGATGFCDETRLSWLSRYSLPLRRLPLGSGATEELLVRRIGRRGLAGLFSDPAGV